MTYDHWKTTNPADAQWEEFPPSDEEMEEMIDEARDRMVANRQRAATRLGAEAVVFATPEGLQRHHYEMLATLVRSHPPRIGRTECLDADQCQDLAEHVQSVANAFATYAREVIREFAQHADLPRRKEVEAYLSDNIADALGALFDAIEDKREAESWRP